MPNLYDLVPILESKYDEINGYDFYKYIFPNNENSNDHPEEYHPNAIYLYTDEEKNKNSRRQLSRRIMLNDTWEEEYMEYVEGNPLALCSGLSYRGRANRLERAQHMNALVFDLDAVNVDCIRNIMHRYENFDYKTLRSIPRPTFIALSGGGIHLYYVFDEPIDLFPNIKVQLKKLKYDLTFRIWEYKATSMEKAIQYQSINQSFRMVGSLNKKNNEIVAFQTGDRVTLEYMNNYARFEENKVDLNKRFRPSKMTRAEAKEKFPDWYQRVIVDGNRAKNKWHVNKALYNWWKNRVSEVKGGHRYFYLMCLAIYAVKCDVSKLELKQDMYDISEILKNIEHSNPFEEKDILSALEAYDKGLFNFTIDDIEKLTDIRIERNKRNGRKQAVHLMGARAIQEINDKVNGTNWRDGNGRPKGSGSKEELVKKYVEEHPGSNPTEISKALKISRTTVYKYLRKS